MLQHSSIGWGQMGTTRNNIAIDYMIHLHIVQVYVDVCFVWSSLIVVPATKRETTRFISYTIAFKLLFFFYFKRKHDSCYNPWIEFSVKTTFFYDISAHRKMQRIQQVTNTQKLKMLA